MSVFRRGSIAIAALGSAALFVLAATPPPAPDTGLAFGDEFWKQWGDGKGELAGYDLTIPRYGQLRQGDRRHRLRHRDVLKLAPGEVRSRKAPEVGRVPGPQAEPRRGFRDGNLRLQPADERLRRAQSRQRPPRGRADQGGVLLAGVVRRRVEPDPLRRGLRPVHPAQLLRRRGRISLEASPCRRRLCRATRCSSGPAGSRRRSCVQEIAGRFPLVRSLENARLNHGAVDLQRAVLSRDPAGARVTVPAGTFDVRRATVEIAGGPTWKFAVETAAPAPHHRMGVERRREGVSPRQRPPRVLEAPRRRSGVLPGAAGLEAAAAANTLIRSEGI